MTVWRDEDAPRHAGELVGVDESGDPYLYRQGRNGYHPWRFVDHLDRPGGAWSGPVRGASPPAHPPAGLRVLCACGWESATVPYRPQIDQAPGAGDGRDAAFWAVDSLQANDAWQEHLAVLLESETSDAPRTIRLQQLASELRPVAYGHPRAALRSVRQLREIAQTLELAALAYARSHNVSWAALAEDLDLPEGTVTSRYTRPPRALSETYGHTDALRYLQGDPGADPTAWPTPTSDATPSSTQAPAPAPHHTAPNDAAQEKRTTLD